MRLRRRLSTLHIALLVSLAVHAALLMLRFADGQRIARAFHDTPLEVILVNARAAERPERAKAQAIAQASLVGGGNAESGLAQSPLPPSPRAEVGDADEEQQLQVERMQPLQEWQEQLLAQIHRELALLPEPDPSRGDKATPQEREQEERRRQLVEQLAEIEKRINVANAGPRRRFVSPLTRDEPYALYYDALRRKIELRGTQNFPESNGRKLYGELIMKILVDAQGRVVDTEIVRPSESKVLDRRAAAIVRAAAPFGAFSQRMRSEADQLVVTSKFRFTHGNALETEQPVIALKAH